MYDTLDWYDPKFVSMYQIINPTYFHMFECIVLVVCYMIHRNYPDVFNITQEILWAAILDWTFNNHLQYQMLSKRSADGCILGILHYNTLNDCIRALGFVAVLWYLTKKSDAYFPLPFTWIFKDLSKFIFESECLRVFQGYLRAKEPEEYVHLDRIIRIYLKTTRTSHEPRLSRLQRGSSDSVGTYLLHPSESKEKQELVDSLNKLRPSFSRFKRTAAFRALFARVKEFEEISQRIYM
jgi:hypothetical protein